jgi:hypothetical protein
MRAVFPGTGLCWCTVIGSVHSGYLVVLLVETPLRLDWEADVIERITYLNLFKSLSFSV